ncbi:amidohydrolase family protein [bacterium]|nr:amidohydrolase family protein [bacterium]
MPTDPRLAELWGYINRLPFFDMHSHLAGFDFGGPVEDRAGRSLRQVLVNDYLAYLSGSCLDAPLTPAKLGETTAADPEQEFREILPLVDRCRAMPTWAVLREGIRELYPFEGEDITEENWRGIHDQIVATYQKWGERAWQREVIRRAGVRYQVQICQLGYLTDHWASLPAEERAAQQAFLFPSLVLDGYYFTGFAVSAEGREKSLKLLNANPKTLAEHLTFCAQVLDRFQAAGGKSVKVLSAYLRSLSFEEVPEKTAAELYARGPETLTGRDLKQFQDFVVRWLLVEATKRRLPIIVHTGYAIPTDWGNPEDLLSVVRLPAMAQAKIAIIHSCWPFEAGGMIMARTYRSCYFDLCWTPLLSPVLGKRILSEAIDIVPLNKIVIGTDCGTAEMFLATVRVTRRLVAEVLATKVARGQFGMNVARQVARAMFWENPHEFHGLEAPALTETGELASA